MSATAAPSLVRAAHASGLHAVERELAALHQAMLRGGAEDGRHVRLSTLTLVSACTDEAGAHTAEEAVARITQSHPARAVIIVALPDDDRPGIEADLSLQCSTQGGDQVCAELVRLRVHGEPARHLVSVVTPLLLPDVPVYLWVVGAPPLTQALSADAAEVCQRVILDSGAYADPQPALGALAEASHSDDFPPLADLAWVRSRVWRELVAQAFDGLEMRPFLARIATASITSRGAKPSAEAWLLAGWLSDRLGWDAGHGPTLDVRGRPDADAPENELLSVELDCADGSRRARITVDRGASAMTTRLEIGGGVTAAGTFPVPSPSVAELVGRVMNEVDRDDLYVPALRRAADLVAHRG